MISWERDKGMRVVQDRSEGWNWRFIHITGLYPGQLSSSQYRGCSEVGTVEHHKIMDFIRLAPTLTIRKRDTTGLNLVERLGSSVL